jgi:hypothetical protein
MLYREIIDVFFRAIQNTQMYDVVWIWNVSTLNHAVHKAGNPDPSLP